MLQPQKEDTFKLVPWTKERKMITYKIETDSPRKPLLNLTEGTISYVTDSKVLYKVAKEVEVILGWKFSKKCHPSLIHL